MLTFPQPISRAKEPQRGAHALSRALNLEFAYVIHSVLTLNRPQLMSVYSALMVAGLAKMETLVFALGQAKKGFVKLKAVVLTHPKLLLRSVDVVSNYSWQGLILLNLSACHPILIAQTL